ncbi:MAG: hypothetical protein J0L53_03140 [Spirochaetes bacterium]|nr:hypothetical protein [Spirochaetota bacterium]MBX3721063.1 hypothetical protein [Turneriella sp.]
MRLLRIFIPVLCAAVLTASVTADSLRAKKPFVPTSHYALQKIEGWSVRVNKDLLSGRQREIGTRVLALLKEKLAEIRRIVPQAAAQKLTNVVIWVGVNDYAIPNATYHPSREWLKEHGWNPDKARGVEISSAATLLSWVKDQPMVILHELTHAYHDQVLGYDNVEIENCYQRAKKSGKYARVKNISGAVMRAYALNDAQEFFAEASEAYFGKNDFYPFTKEDLRKFDSETFNVVETLWNR